MSSVIRSLSNVLRVALFSILGTLLGFVSARGQLGPKPLASFPSESATDGRFLGLACAGLATLERNVQVALAVPASTSTFSLNLFDGETGGLDGMDTAHWDLGTRQLKFALHADPSRKGSILPADLIGVWYGNKRNPIAGPLWTSTAANMPDNAWWGVTITNAAIAQTPSGNYFYNLVIDTDGACEVGEILESNFKIAASYPVSFNTSHFGLVGALRQLAADLPILYPGSLPTAPLTGSFVSAPTTYDGSFDLYFNLSASETELRLIDGDFDFGTDAARGVPSGLFLDECADEDDPDTPADYGNFPFVVVAANPEGVQGPGIPSDDNKFDAFRRGEPGDPNRIGCVRYEVQDPVGNVYYNDNPSGSFEWEQFLIASVNSPFVGDADYVYGDALLPAGSWKVSIVGLDLANLNFWYAKTCATRPAHEPLPSEDPIDVPRVPACGDESIYLLGNLVWADTANPGVLDPGEVGMPGVVMELIRPSDGVVLATAVTGDPTSPNWAACRASSTGVDSNGLYCFGQDVPGTYEVRVAARNFTSGGALFGQVATTGNSSLTRTLTAANVLTFDFGFSGMRSSRAR